MNVASFYHKKAVKFTLFIVWAILFAALLRRDFFIESVDSQAIQTVNQAEAMEYQSIYFKNDKIGYVESEYRKKADDLWTLHQKAEMQLNIGGKKQQMDLDLLAELNDFNHLKSFSFTFLSPFYKMNAEGNVTDNRVNYTLHSGSSTIRDSINFPAPPLLTAARRTYLLALEMKTGDKRKIPWFEPFTLTGKESVVQYNGVEPQRIGGRVLKLHHFTETLLGTKVNFWLNDEGTTVKEESPAGFVFIKEPKFKALKINGSGKEILSSVAVKPDAPMPEDYQERSEMSYRLKLPKENEFTLNSDNQKFSNGILTVQKNAPVSTTCTTGTGYLAASPYLQADNPEIVKLARELTAGISTDTGKLHILSDWVYKNLEKRPVLGLPDALTTLHNKQGDCNEHAVLFAALARAAGIPTRIAAGVVYTDWGKAFYYHAWNEACVDKHWISLDTTTNQIPADVSHIKFAEGEMDELLRIGALIGQLGITPLPDSPSITN